MNAKIEIDRQNRVLEIRGGPHRTVFPIAVGKSETPTPPGIFYIHSKWEKGDRVVEEHGKCLGSHCLTLGQFAENGTLQPVGKDKEGGLALVNEDDLCYAIHGTDEPDSINTAVGLGCVRMHNCSIERLYKWVDVGDVVVII